MGRNKKISLNRFECPNEIKGINLRAGMVTFKRVVGRDGDVEFRRDHHLLEFIGICRPSGIHFRTDKGDVCYWTGARVWVKEEVKEDESGDSDGKPDPPDVEVESVC